MAGTVGKGKTPHLSQRAKFKMFVFGTLLYVQQKIKTTVERNNTNYLLH